MASAMVALLGLAVLNPERMIADGDIDRLEAAKKIDYLHLGGPSPSRYGTACSSGRSPS